MPRERADGSTLASLTEGAIFEVENAMQAWSGRSDDPPWTDYVSRAWVARRVRHHAATYVHDFPVLDAVTDDYFDAVIKAHMAPTHCRGQRQFKLTA